LGSVQKQKRQEKKHKQNGTKEACQKNLRVGKNVQTGEKKRSSKKKDQQEE